MGLDSPFRNWSRGSLLLKIYAIAAASIITAPIYLLYIDRTPPFERLEACSEDNPETAEDPCSKVIPSIVVLDKASKTRPTIRVRYVTSRPIPGRRCPGTVHQEFFDSLGFRDQQREERPAVPASWEDHPTDPSKAIFVGNPVPVPRNLEPGRIRFQSTTFRYCNFLQELMHRPIVRSGPVLEFFLIVIDEAGVQQ
jgi:hypothetical protein